MIGGLVAFFILLPLVFAAGIFLIKNEYHKYGWPIVSVVIVVYIIEIYGVTSTCRRNRKVNQLSKISIVSREKVI